MISEAQETLESAAGLYVYRGLENEKNVVEK